MRKPINVAILLAVLVLLCIPGAVFAAGGTGDGSGGGKLQPLAITNALPADGATGVGLSDQIKLTFSKNVVYMTVRENNRGCFSLWNGDTRVPIEVIMADDQIEREKRNDVIIKPLAKLQPGTTYRVEVEPGLESKSGVTLGQKATLSFTTAGTKASDKTGQQATEASPSVPTPTDSQERTVAPQMEAAATDSSQAIARTEPEIATVDASAALKPDQNQVLAQQNEPNAAAQEKDRNNRIIIDIIIVIAAGLAAWWFYRKWRHP
ncbi:MAG: Ig-like domain-containing protein [Syntrophomonadaceae bacterium]|jgi:hypothetical protein